MERNWLGQGWLVHSVQDGPFVEPVPASVPTNIHLDLINAGKIPDPNLARNEALVQDLHGLDWIYQLDFEYSSQSTYRDLCFDGLDTYATVWLNNHKILESDNAFVAHRVPVNSQLKTGTNRLIIQFDSALLKANDLLRRDEKQYGHKICWNGHYCRLFVRKPQYHFGWDWGPALITCGPWKNIYLESYESRISDYNIESSVSDNLDQATIDIDVSVQHSRTSQSIQVTVGNRKQTHNLSSAQIRARFTIQDPGLWYPFTHGHQPLYEVQIRLLDGEQQIDSKSSRIGLRKLELVQAPFKNGAQGTSFYFRVNNLPAFCGGANWIPGDSFLPRILKQNGYRRWAEIMRQGRQNMLRVWGGGCYEDDSLYDACDELGILVWQDFAFACGQYPATESFRESVTKEIKCNLRRIKNHPSLAILAGNNEDYQVADEELHYDQSLPETQWLSSEFPARYIYEKLLPDLCRQYAPSVHYHPGSPWGGEDSSDKTQGDIHQWNVWGGVMAPYQRYGELGGRFVSEFGMVAMPVSKTVRQAFLAGQPESEHHPQSKSVEHHMKAHSYERRVNAYLGENFRMHYDFETYIYLTQMLQAEAVHFAYTSWRRQFGRDGARECGGALVWQINDAWPANSWAVVDYYKRPKPGFYAIRRAIAPITVGMLRKTNNPKPNSRIDAVCSAKCYAKATGVSIHSTPHLYPPKVSTVDIWLVNGTCESQPVKLFVEMINVDSGQREGTLITQGYDIAAFETKEIAADISVPEDIPVVLSATLTARNGDILARYADWPQPFKHLSFRERQVEVDVQQDQIRLSASKPVKGLVMSLADDLIDKVWLPDNYIDLMPDNDYFVSAPGLPANARISYRYYGDRD